MVKPPKAVTRAEYAPLSAELMQQGALTLMTVLGDFYGDVVIVGGLVPSLLIPVPPIDAAAHPGTMDLDLGLSLGVLENERYTKIAERLRLAGFAPAKNKDGRSMRQTWQLDSAAGRVLVDFLIGAVSPASVPGKLQNLDGDFAAFIAEGIPLAFRDKRVVTLQGRTLKDEVAKRDALVCGPSAFMALKAIAFRNRGAQKDAYDLYYVLRNYGGAFDEIVAGYQSLLTGDGASCAARALTYLEDDFQVADGVGPSRAAEFILGSEETGRAELRADVSGIVTRFIKALK